MIGGLAGCHDLVIMVGSFDQPFAVVSVHDRAGEEEIMKTLLSNAIV